jgi:transcriptional regulator with XRE-family HTH domain
MRIRELRMILGLSQQQLADLTGLVYQQVYKYERGINSVSAGRLYEIARELDAPHEIARELDAPLEYFFEGLENTKCLLLHAGLPDVMRRIGGIENEKHQEAISQLIRALADR